MMKYRQFYTLRIAQVLDIDMIEAEQVLDDMESRGVVEILDRQFKNEVEYAYNFGGQEKWVSVGSTSYRREKAESSS